MHPPAKQYLATTVHTDDTIPYSTCSLVSFTSKLEPTYFTIAFKSLAWHCAMNKEFDAFLHNNNWSLVSITFKMHTIDCSGSFVINAKHMAVLSTIRLVLSLKDFISNQKLTTMRRTTYYQVTNHFPSSICCCYS